MAGDAAAIILAAGTGERLGGLEPKAFVELGERPLFSWAIGNAASCERISSIVVTVPEGLEERARGAIDTARPVTVVVGGETRQASVRAALLAAPDARVLVCHDAARPFAPTSLFDAVLDALEGPSEADGAVPVLSISDTVKRVRDGVVVATEDRNGLGISQTPQAFTASALREAHERADAEELEFTDDAAVVEWAGYRVVTVAGSVGNFKITSPEDLERARSFVAEVTRG